MSLQVGLHLKHHLVSYLVTTRPLPSQPQQKHPESTVGAKEEVGESMVEDKLDVFSAKPSEGRD